jgi:uncharacterized protein
MDVRPADDSTSRRAPRLALPPYRYLPGRTPHPLRHVGGHLRDPNAPRPANDSEALAYARDLFAARYYWEAHEVWEELWHRAVGVDRDVLQSLIQFAAGRLKLELGSVRLARVLFEAAHDRLAKIEEPSALGFEIAPLRAALSRALGGEIDPRDEDWLE